MDYIRISELNTEDRPRERLVALGAEALSNRELLAIVLRSGTMGMSSLDLATRILNKFDNNFDLLAKAGDEELKTIKGVGEAKSAEIIAIFELATRMANHKKPARIKVKGPKDAAGYIGLSMSRKEQEEFHIIILDVQNYIMKSIMITKGLLDRTQIHPREVFRPAIQSNCSKIILAHNHPSGDIKPSKYDLSSTKIIKEAGDIIGIAVLDHIIIAPAPENHDDNYIFASLKETGYYSF